MTPLQFAQQQCANYNKDGSCSGIGIKDDGSLFMCGSKPKCVLANKIPCRYFEECVIPMGIEITTAVNAQREKERQEAKDLYARFAPSYSKNGSRVCEHCHSRPVAPRHRLCSLCAKSKEKERVRASMQKRRSAVTKVDQKTP